MKLEHSTSATEDRETERSRTARAEKNDYIQANFMISIKSTPKSS